jgi:iron complex outermembrane receptor protein
MGSYAFEAGTAGKFEIGLSATYFDTYEVAITPAADRIDQLNTIYNPLRFKARANATWSRGGILGAYTSTIWMSMTTTS